MNGRFSVVVGSSQIDHLTETERKKKQRTNLQSSQEEASDQIGFSHQPPFGEALITPFTVSSMGKMHKIQPPEQQPQQHCTTCTNAEAYNFIPSPPSSWHERRNTIEKGPNNNIVLSTNVRDKRRNTTFNDNVNNHNPRSNTFFPYSISIPSRLPTPPPLPPLYSDLRNDLLRNGLGKSIMPPIKKPPPPPQTSQKGGRGRIAVACDPCRAFKRKCSGEQPCELCRRRGRSHECKYEPGPCSLPRAQPIEPGPSTPKTQKPINHLRKTSSSSTTKGTQKDESETSDSDFEFEDTQENKSDQFSNSAMVQWNNTPQAHFQPQPFAPPPLPPIENNYENRYRSRSFSHPYAYSRNVLPLPRLTVVEPVQTRHRRSYSLHTPATRGESPESRRE
jgi:Fungal Zn(2)-Cys(6) binuclear cluster domain